MSQFNKASFKTAASGYSSFPLSGQVVSTHDFGVPYRPVFAREVVPGDRWHIKLDCFTRLSSMVLPTFGRCKIVNRFFYVPYSVIHDSWNEFMSGQDVATLGGIRVTPACNTISNQTIVDAFIRAYDGNIEDFNIAPLTEKGVATAVADFVITDSGNAVTYRFTKYGRICFSILKGLGYGINWTLSDTTVMSAMPFIAYCKVCYDWLVDSNFVNSVDFDANGLFHLNGALLSYGMLINGLRVFACFYDKDYFTASWQQPNQVDSSAVSNPFSTSLRAYNVVNANQNGVARQSSVQNNPSGTTLTVVKTNTDTFFSEYGLRVLESVSSFIRKRLLTGFRHDKQLEAEFGLKLDPEIAGRSYYIGSVEVPVEISDVMSTASTTDASLGEYAGKGIGFNDGQFTFEERHQEFGIILCMSAVVPDIHYFQGRNRELFHVARTDFFTPEFEDVGPQTIRNDELFTGFTTESDYSAGQGYGGNPDGIFGYSPRYSEYKTGVQTDNILGDYLIKDFNGSGVMDSFHFFRKFATPSSTSPLSNTYSFKTTADASQFNRVFQVTSNEPEHFNVMYNFNISVDRLMLPINTLPDIKGYGRYLEMKHMDDLLPG